MQQFNPMQYIAIAIANQAGLDKKSWEERINWVKINKNHLEDLVPEDPKTKFLYIKAVKALRDAEKGIPTGYIMDLDCTNSGVQIMAALGKCYQSATTCNVVNTGNREDLYQMILDKTNNQHIDRDRIKKAIIPMLYGSTASPKAVFGEDTPELQEFNKAVYQTVPVLSQMTVYAQNMWQDDALAHKYVMPDGHVVYLPNHETKAYNVDGLIIRRTELCTTEDSTPLLANIVHSVDGYVVRQMIRMAKRQGFQLAAIHDSFWASPVHMQKVRENFVHIMHDLAKSNLLEDIIYQLTGEKHALMYSDPELYKEIRFAEYMLS